jgi:hypothetical protein
MRKSVWPRSCHVHSKNIALGDSLLGTCQDVDSRRHRTSDGSNILCCRCRTRRLDTTHRLDTPPIRKAAICLASRLTQLTSPPALSAPPSPAPTIDFRTRTTRLLRILRSCCPRSVWHAADVALAWLFPEANGASHCSVSVVHVVTPK